MRLRVDDLAARSGVSVDTVRFYQSRGLIPPPMREGRVAWYSAEHLERLGRIRDLKSRGFTLASIERLLSGETDEADEALVSAVLGATDGPEEFLTLEQLAERTGVSGALLEAIEREGLLVARVRDGERRYTADDAHALRAGLTLLEAGLPLGDLLSLARRHDDAMRQVASTAVDMFVRFVRDPILAQADSEDEAARRLVYAFARMLPATTSLVAHHFQRVLLQVAQDRIEKEGIKVDLESARGGR